MVTSSKRAYATGCVTRSPASRVPAPAADHSWPLLWRRHSNTVLAQSLWGLWVLVHTRFFWALRALWWVWGLVLNVISPSWIDAFELWCWRRLLRAPWTARKSNQLILNEISVEYSLEGLMLKLKLQYFGHMMQRTDWPQCCKKLKAGGEGDDRGWAGWMVSLTQWTLVWASFGSWWWTGRPGVLQPMGWQGIRQNWVTELTDWSIFILQFRLFVWIFLMLTFLCFTVFTLV